VLRPAIAPSSQPDRFFVLDALRGIAAVVVVIAHAVQLCYGYELEFLHGMGRFGVVLFFLVSGFVIPASFARSSQRTFWIRRLCRLFPAYWTTIGIAAVLAWLNWLPASPFYGTRSVATYVVNLTMVPNFFNYSSVLFVFWSLHIELVFYLFVAVMGLLGIQHKTSLVGLVLLVATLAPAFVPELPFTLYYPLFLAIIWCGTVFQRVHYGHESLLSAAPFVAAALVLVWLAEGSTARALYHKGGTLTAFAVVLVALRHPTWFQRPLLVWLGTVSYSLYLLHLLVLAVVPASGPPVLSVTIWVICMLLVAAVAERWIERPSLALGRHLTAPRERRMAGIGDKTVLST
jgi:peptidoglycan/LPS O-acetylase OafA/YrhL